MDSLVSFAKYILNNVFWIENYPPPAMEALYFDLAHISIYKKSESEKLQ